jgi:hypothetical protein
MRDSAIVASCSAIGETVMQSGSVSPKRCAYCHEPFCFNSEQVHALPAGNQFVCSEFCAQALREEAHLTAKRLGLKQAS